jgi:hypothetical protein
MTRTFMSRRRSRSSVAVARKGSSVSSTVELVESRISLQYPNGRTHTTSLFGETELQPGEEFELHGRRWRVLGPPARRRRSGREPERLLCLAIPPN